ncbi:hypothetical protein MCOR04_007712 [Pyricularia oryzae]|nr:hypothetical protein MCOR04_007712 [Pyricularia oryzae]
MAEPQQPTKAEPWWAALPAPRARCPTLPADEVLKLLEENTGTASGASDVLLVDVRRDDWTGGTVAGSVNLPAQSLYATRGAIYDLCRRAGVKRDPAQTEAGDGSVQTGSRTTSTKRATLRSRGCCWKEASRGG